MTERDLYLVFAAVAVVGVVMFAVGALSLVAYMRQGRSARFLLALVPAVVKTRARLAIEQRREVDQLRLERDDALQIITELRAEIGTQSSTIGHLRKLVARRDERAAAAEHRERLAVEHAQMLYAGCVALARSWDRLGPAVALGLATTELLGLLQQLGDPAKIRSGS
ncbi:hypothetical protein [Microtetraspora malaysiensis]|uniref:Uncharacterized protein n=1 Tax=Microtetraspora malaysiensis TaxID=161358 RepID=A0ABW6T6Z2_9ACTN